MSERYTQFYEPQIKASNDGTITVSILHYGAYSYLNEAYNYLQNWLDTNGYAPKQKEMYGKLDSIREIYIKDNSNSRCKEEFQTRLELEIIKKGDKTNEKV